jgi:hypothetical protein
MMQDPIPPMKIHATDKTHLDHEHSMLAFKLEILKQFVTLLVCLFHVSVTIALTNFSGQISTYQFSPDLTCVGL